MISFDLTKDEFAELVNSSKRPSLVQLMAKVRSDCSPLQLYTTFQGEDYSYMLESVEKEKRHARFSFVGAYPDVVAKISGRRLTLEYGDDSVLIDTIRSKLDVKCENIVDDGSVLKADIKGGSDVVDALRAVFPTADGTTLLNGKRFDRQTFLGGAIGYNGYDMIYDCWLDIEKSHQSDVPDMQFILTTRTFVFDHLTGETYMVLTPFAGEGCDPGKLYNDALKEAEEMCQCLRDAVAVELGELPELSGSSEAVCNMDQDSFEKAVVAAKEHILDGDIFQVVLSRRYSMEIEQTPLELYRTLRGINPSPYMYLFSFRDLDIVGASPETLMTVHERKVITNPIAGTCPRGKDEVEDDEYAAKMMSDRKERAEHVMLVDLGRNDVRMVSKSGSVKVSDFMSVVKYSHVQHIESTVCGELRPECDQFDATRAIFPAGTLSGAPKIRAMEIIDEFEPSARGIYGGGVGYYSWNGDVDTAIVIRTVIIKDGIANVQAGAGIVADSDPTYEYEETERKMAAMIAAMGGKR
ncbi:anthranilate synthase component I [Methanococcoides sp. FTZ1]|uniref:anthranilate synthase component I n=1 Tax=Methanococcoides sp. FTZ1 TaxID=3439061 RepID=UPI003F871D9A